MKMSGFAVSIGKMRIVLIYLIKLLMSNFEINQGTENCENHSNHF